MNLLSRDNRNVHLRFDQHQYFDPEAEICIALRLGFISAVPAMAYPQAYKLRLGIERYLDFRAQYNSARKPIFHINRLLDISSENFKAYINYQFKNGLPIGPASALRKLLTRLALESNSLGHLSDLPTIPTKKNSPREPLDDEAFEDLSAALFPHVDLIYEKLKFRAEVAESQGYSVIEIRETLGSVGVRGWAPENARMIRTFLDNGWPLDVPRDELLTRYSGERYQGVSVDSIEDNPVLLILHRLTAQGSKFATPTIDQLLGMYFPTKLDAWVLLTSTALQSGWNKETICNLRGTCNIESIENLGSTGDVIIFSEKFRSQSVGLTYENSSDEIAFSNFADPYSFASLIQLAEELTKPILGFEYEKPSVDVGPDYSRLFLYLHKKGDWHHNRVASASDSKCLGATARNFFSKHEIVTEGDRIRTAMDLNGRLRPTWTQQSKRQGKSIELVSKLMGHKDRRTTDVHYDNSGAARKSRERRLRSELTEVLALLRARKFKGLVGELSERTKRRAELSLFKLPGHENPMWGCTDATSPDWPGAEPSRFSKKKPCRSLGKCLSCSRMYIFLESLPYLVQRYKHILADEAEDASEYGNELIVLEELLESWPDKEEVLEAERYQKIHQPLLPLDLEHLSEIAFQE